MSPGLHAVALEPPSSGRRLRYVLYCEAIDAGCMAVGDLGASLEMTGRGGLGGPLSAIGLRLTEWKLRAVGCRLLAFGFRRAFGNPPSPLRGPLPPDKQWGAREYIGARYIAPFAGRSNGVRTLAKNVRSHLKRRRNCRPLSKSRHNLRRQAAMSPATQKKTAGAVFFHISIPGPVPPGSGRCPGYRSGWRRL